MASEVCFMIDFWLGSQLNKFSSSNTRVDSLPLASCTEFLPHPAPGYGWWVTGNFNVWYGCALPYLWDIPHTVVGLDRTATPPHTPCSPTCSGFCVSPWRKWCRPGLCLPSSGILPCSMYHNYAYGTMTPSAEEVSFPMCPLNSFPYFLHILGGSGHGYWSQVSLRVTLIGGGVVSHTKGNRGWTPWWNFGYSCKCGPALQYCPSSWTCIWRHLP